MNHSPVKGARERFGSGELSSGFSLSNDYFTNMLKEPWWPKLIELSLPFQDKRNDEGHTASVILWAEVLLGSAEHNSDDRLGLPERNLVLPAALLHDIGWSRLSEAERIRLFDGDLPENEERVLRLKHERLGAKFAGQLMRQCGCSERLTESVCELIDGHDTRGAFMSVEDGILRDADKLWMITDRGFKADLSRRKLTPFSWASILRERFTRTDSLYLQESKTIMLDRLEELQPELKRIPAKPRVLIAHYRVGWTDGVSLEIEKRKVILEEMGFEVLLLSGSGSRGADFIIDELDFESESVKMIARNAFGSISEYESPDQLMADILAVSDVIEHKLSEIVLRVEPDFILTHNIFSHGRHISAARAFFKVLSCYGAASLTTHHDFYWERDDYRIPSCLEVADFLSRYVPPRIEGMHHAVINSLAAVELELRTGIKPMIFPDTLDFTVPPWVKDSYNENFPSDFNLREDDILILQATRIVRRKGIELIPPVISRLNSVEYLDKLRGKRLYNGKKVTDKSRFVFLLAGYAEHEAEAYRDQLEDLMKAENIEYRFLHPFISADRAEIDGRKVYSLFDTYPWADLVSYPSIYEGWGNQFIEAVFARKPVVLYEYPVFKSDIKPIGYNVISMGCEAEQGRGADSEGGLYSMPADCVDQCCDNIIQWLLSDQTEEKLNENFMLARQNNSYNYLRKLMKQSMAHYEDY